MSNVTTGDIAMVVRAATPFDCTGMVGTPIEVEHPIDHPLGLAWTFKGPPLRCACGQDVCGFFDHQLQRMRPAGHGKTLAEPIDAGELAHG